MSRFMIRGRCSFCSCVYLYKLEFNLSKNIYQKEEPKKLLKDFIESNNIKQEDIEAIVTTGVGRIEEKEYSKIPVVYIDEFKSIGLGGLIASNKEKVIVASIGTGTAFIKANKNKIEHLGGSRSRRWHIL